MRAKPAVALALTLCAVASLAIPLAAREQIPAETREFGYSAQLAACDSPSVLSHIQSRFASTERRFWNSEAEIVAIDRVEQAAFRPHGLDLIPRRYCKAVATMSDTRRLNLRYAIIEGGGPIGMTDGIQFCLDGYDRGYTAMPGCNRLDR